MQQPLPHRSELNASIAKMPAAAAILLPETKSTTSFCDPQYVQTVVAAVCTDRSWGRLGSDRILTTPWLSTCATIYEVNLFVTESEAFKAEVCVLTKKNASAALA